MKKQLLLLAVALFATATAVWAQEPVRINSTNFPDSKFREIVKGKDIDKNQDGWLETGELAAVTTLTARSKSIESLKGVEHFFKLTALHCENNRLSSLDVSMITTLKGLYCSQNRLTSLDVSKNTALTILYCYENKLTSLDVSKNMALTALLCYDNKLTSLDLTNNKALTNLSCYINQIGHSDMLKLVNSLPTVAKGYFHGISISSSREKNVLPKSCVEIAQGKGWNVLAKDGSSNVDYEGSEDPIAINATNFPDENFRSVVAGTDIDKDADGYLSDEEIAAVTKLKVLNKNIASLKGIEFFTALQYLGCFNNQLTSLDVSKNTALQYLLCGSNQLASLDVSKNSALTYLNCNNNQLTSLDVSKNSALTELYCDNNQLTSLDVSKNTALLYLECHDNKLTSLDVSKNTALLYLFCYYNQLTSLDVSKNTALLDLQCYDNKLTSLDVSKNTALTCLGCNNNQIKGDKMQALVNSLPTVTNGRFYVIYTKDSDEQNVCTKPQVKIATDKGWKVYAYIDEDWEEYAGSDPGIAINATNFPDENFRTIVAGTDIDKDADGYLSDEEIAAVTKLDVSEKNIASLKGIEFFTALQNLYCYNNQLTSLDVSKNTALKVLYCFDNQLASLDVSKNTALTKLYCDGNELTSLDVSKNTALKDLWCYGNQLTSLDVSKNTKLESLSCGNNQLTSLDVSKNSALIDLDCNGNQLTSLDVSKNTALQYLRCYNNQLTSLDVSKNTALVQLWCSNNQLTALDVSKNTALTELDLSFNQLKSLDVSKSTALEELYCYGNQLTSLDVSKNTALIFLACFNNQIKEDQMLKLVNSLPTVTNGQFYVINTKNSNEQNVCTKPQVKIATDKGWKVYDYNGGSVQEYAGSEPSAIGSIEVSAEEKGLWYSLDGKRLSGEPTKKGIYVRNGRKVVVK